MTDEQRRQQVKRMIEKLRKLGLVAEQEQDSSSKQESNETAEAIANF